MFSPALTLLGIHTAAVQPPEKTQSLTATLIFTILLDGRKGVGGIDGGWTYGHMCVHTPAHARVLLRTLTFLHLIPVRLLKHPSHLTEGPHEADCEAVGRRLSQS